MGTKESFDRMYRSVTIMEARTTSHVEGMNLTYRDMLYLDFIALTRGCTVSMMSEALGVSLPAATRRTNSLEERGLVARTRSSDDARCKTVELTEMGDEIMAESDKAVSEVLRALEERYPPHEVARFCEMMDCMSELFESHLTLRSGRQSQRLSTRSRLEGHEGLRGLRARRQDGHGG